MSTRMRKAPRASRKGQEQVKARRSCCLRQRRVAGYGAEIVMRPGSAIMPPGDLSFWLQRGLIPPEVVDGGLPCWDRRRARC